jgi:hypothetical protein
LWLDVFSAFAVEELSLTQFGFLVLLNDRAAGTTARRQEIGDKIAFQAVFLADIETLEERWDNMETEAREPSEHEALGVTCGCQHKHSPNNDQFNGPSIWKQCWGYVGRSRTHRSV